MEALMEAKVEVEILRMIRQVDKKQDQLTKILDDHMIKEEGDWNFMKETLDGLIKAFPNEDMEGHHNYHNSLIERNKWITQMCKDIVKEITKYGLIGFLAWLGYQAWLGFLAGPK